MRNKILFISGANFSSVSVKQNIVLQKAVAANIATGVELRSDTTRTTILAQADNNTLWKNGQQDYPNKSNYALIPLPTSSRKIRVTAPGKTVSVGLVDSNYKFMNIGAVWTQDIVEVEYYQTDAVYFTLNFQTGTITWDDFIIEFF